MRHVELLGCFPTGRHYPGVAHLLRVVASGIAEEFAADRSVPELSIVSIDTETTGRDPALDRIVELACIRWNGHEIVSRRSWLVNPERPIPQEAFDVHGIGDEDVKHKPPFGEIAEEVLRELEGAVPLAYNAEYDRKVLHSELGRLGRSFEQNPPAFRRAVDWLDPLIWARELHKYEKSKSLAEVSQRLGIELVKAHRAEHDAEAALRIHLAFLPDVRVPKTYGAFLQEQRRLGRLFDEERRIWRNRVGDRPVQPAPSAPAVR